MTVTEGEKLFRDFLSRRGMLFTKERARILVIIFNQQDHFTAESLIMEMASEQVKVSRATLYRALSNLVEAEIIDKVDLGNGHAYYEPRGSKCKHEHMTCEKCSRVIEISIPNLESLIAEVQARTTFSNIRYKLQLCGLCPECRRRR